MYTCICIYVFRPLFICVSTGLTLEVKGGQPIFKSQRKQSRLTYNPSLQPQTLNPEP